MKHAEHMERKRHGSPDFPIKYYYVNEDHPQYIMPAHWHKEFEIIRILDGAFTVHLNNSEYYLEKGDILFVEGGCLHRGEPADSVYECFVFDPAILMRQQNDAAEKYISPIINMQISINHLVDRTDIGIQQTVAELFTKVREQKPCYELEVYGLVFRLFAQMYLQEYIVPSVKPIHNLQARTIMELIDWIDKNSSEQMSLDTLAARAGLSKKYLCRIFKEYTSKTLVEYINELRIENACYELSVRGKNITEASYDSGFNDLSYFCKIFKRYKGITPKEYKKRQSPEQN